MTEEQRTINGFNYNYGFDNKDVMFIQFLREDGLNDSQIAAVVNALNSICKTCFNATRGCFCGRDD